MSTLKIHLEHEEMAAVARLAKTLGVTLDDLGYAAINRMMRQTPEAESGLSNEILEVRVSREYSLPIWSDSARAVHIYESLPDDEQRPSGRHPSPN